MEPLTYTAKQVAELLQITEQSVYTLRNSGKLPAIKAIGRVLFNRKDVHAFVGIQDEYTPWNFHKLQIENQKLQKENDELKAKIKAATRDMLQLVGENI